MKDLNSVLTQEMLFTKVEREINALDKSEKDKVDLLFDRCMEEGIMPERFNPSNESFKEHILEFNEQMKQYLNYGREKLREGEQKGEIKGIIQTLRDTNHYTKDQTREHLIRKTRLSPQEADEYLEKYY